MNNTVNKICEVLTDIGIYIDIDGITFSDEDVDLRDYIMDSITYIYFVMSLEDKFGFTFFNQSSLYNQMASIKSLAQTIDEIISLPDERKNLV